ncbi:hypothetical protein L596_009613 [Steinernema carpocapsae]|uniref:Uncharacterized protein n=1 Tax=Steinernema carpocapsae TaxID=34508 RepID=A0A4V6A6N3_STECR|nr:hypothetical protein L596_009613 [Steinernema carpocapsae]
MHSTSETRPPKWKENSANPHVKLLVEEISDFCSKPDDSGNPKLFPAFMSHTIQSKSGAKISELTDAFVFCCRSHCAPVIKALGKGNSTKRKELNVSKFLALEYIKSMPTTAMGTDLLPQKWNESTCVSEDNLDSPNLPFVFSCHAFYEATGYTELSTKFYTGRMLFNRIAPSELAGSSILYVLKQRLKKESLCMLPAAWNKTEQVFRREHICTHGNFAFKFNRTARSDFGINFYVDQNATDVMSSVCTTFVNATLNGNLDEWSVKISFAPYWGEWRGRAHQNRITVAFTARFDCPHIIDRAGDRNIIIATQLRGRDYVNFLDPREFYSVFRPHFCAYTDKFEHYVNNNIYSKGKEFFCPVFYDVTKDMNVQLVFGGNLYVFDYERKLRDATIKGKTCALIEGKLYNLRDKNGQIKTCGKPEHAYKELQASEGV